MEDKPEQPTLVSTRRVRFSQEGDSVVFVPKDSYVDKVGDARDDSNPNYALIGMARDQRLRGVGDSLLLAKLLWHWRHGSKESPSTASRLSDKHEDSDRGHKKGKRAQDKARKRRRSREEIWGALEAHAGSCMQSP